MFVCSVSFGQGYSNGGNANPLDTFRIKDNYFLFLKSYRTPFYASAVDSNFHLTIPGGLNIKYSIGQFISRLAATIGVPGFQNVLSTNSTLTQNNDINLSGFQLRTYNGLWKSDAAQIGSLLLDAKAMYNSNLGPFSGQQIPDAAWVLSQVSSSITAGNGLLKTGSILELGDLTKPTFINGNNNQYVIYNLGPSGFSNSSGALIGFGSKTVNLGGDTVNFYLPTSALQYNIVPNPDNALTTKDIMWPSRSGTWALIEDITESSFDTTMSTTVTSLTSPRFSRPVSTVYYAGLTYNSDYFTQVGTMITFIGLTFYNGQKLTFTLR